MHRFFRKLALHLFQSEAAALPLPVQRRLEVLEQLGRTVADLRVRAHGRRGARPGGLGLILTTG